MSIITAGEESDGRDSSLVRRPMILTAITCTEVVIITEENLMQSNLQWNHPCAIYNWPL